MKGFVFLVSNKHVRETISVLFFSMFNFICFIHFILFTPTQTQLPVDSPITLKNIIQGNLKHQQILMKIVKYCILHRANKTREQSTIFLAQLTGFKINKCKVNCMRKKKGDIRMKKVEVYPLEEQKEQHIKDMFPTL